MPARPNKDTGTWGVNTNIASAGVPLLLALLVNLVVHFTALSQLTELLSHVIILRQV